MRTIFILIFLFSTIFSYAQITTLGAPVKDSVKLVIPQYDSLTNINACYPFQDSPHKKSYKHLIGQKVYVVNNSGLAQLKKYVWYGKDIRNRDWDIKGHYMNVIDIENYRKGLNESDYYHSMRTSFMDVAFQDETDGQVYFYEDSDIKYILNDNLVIVGHFEKIKQKYEGKELVFVMDDEKSERIGNGIYDLGSRKRIETIKKGTLFICAGVSIDDAEGSEGFHNSPYYYIEDRVVILLHNDDLGDFYCYATSKDMTDTYDKKVQTRCKNYILGKFLTPEDYAKKQRNDAIAANQKKEAEKAKAEEEQAKAKERAEKEQQRIQGLVKKYGQSNVDLARQGKVKIGWNKELCKEAWGEPRSINKTTTAYGVHEQWVYYGNRYLYFDDGVLTSIQE